MVTICVIKIDFGAMIMELNPKVEVKGFKSFHLQPKYNLGVLCVWLALGGLG